MFNAGVLFRKSADKPEKNVGIPQGNPISPLLANVYLHKLDKFILKRKEIVWDKNSLGKYCGCLTKKWRKAIYVSVNELKNAESSHQKTNLKKNLKRQKIRAAKAMGIMRTSLTNETQMTAIEEKYHRVYYVRYIDDFLLGIKGPKILAINVREEISQFIKSNLQLELKFADLHHAKSSKVRYLEFDVRIPNYKHIGMSKLKDNIAFKKLRNKIKQRKSIVEYRWKTFLDRIICRKIANKVNGILRGMCGKKTNETKYLEKYYSTQLEKNLFVHA